jgi:hypothetical protein
MRRRITEASMRMLAPSPRASILITLQAEFWVHQSLPAGSSIVVGQNTPGRG